jgi:hypothetical protein
LRTVRVILYVQNLLTYEREDKDIIKISYCWSLHKAKKMKKMKKKTLEKEKTLIKDMKKIK